MSIKLRVAIAFTLALAAAFALGSWLFVSHLNAQLFTALDKTVIAQLASYQTADDLESAAPISAPRNSLVQVISPSGRVLGHSAEAGTAPLLNPNQVRRARSTGLTKAIGDEQFRFHAAPIRETGAIAVVGVSIEGQVSAPLRAQTEALVIGGAIFVLIGGIGAYWFGAAALRPVERLRREVAALSASDSAKGIQVPRTRDELASLAGTMNDLLARLHDALARQREFVADASHELRTPLAILGAELELAGRPGRSPGALAEAVANAEDEVARLTRLTNDLLTLARSEEGKLPVQSAKTRITDLLERSVEGAARPAAAADVACVVEAAPDLVAFVDADRIRQAVDNLIDNSLRFAPAGTRITVTARTEDSTLLIEVADRGPGFPADYLPHVFERFRRPDGSRSRSDGGAGLGLAIVAAVAAAHGGTATACNQPGGGAIVALELPDAVVA